MNRFSTGGSASATALETMPASAREIPPDSSGTLVRSSGTGRHTSRVCFDEANPPGQSPVTLLNAGINA